MFVRLFSLISMKIVFRQSLICCSPRATNSQFYLKALTVTLFCSALPLMDDGSASCRTNWPVLPPLPHILSPSYSPSFIFSLPHIPFPACSLSLLFSLPHIPPLPYFLSLILSFPHIPAPSYSLSLMFSFPPIPLSHILSPLCSLFLIFSPRPWCPIVHGDRDEHLEHDDHLNHDEWMSESVRYVDIELLGQLKIWGCISPLFCNSDIHCLH